MQCRLCRQATEHWLFDMYCFSKSHHTVGLACLNRPSCESGSTCSSRNACPAPAVYVVLINVCVFLLLRSAWLSLIPLPAHVAPEYCCLLCVLGGDHLVCYDATARLACVSITPVATTALCCGRSRGTHAQQQHRIASGLHQTPAAGRQRLLLLFGSPLCLHQLAMSSTAKRQVLCVYCICNSFNCWPCLD
jgi:hypothetical protein